MKRADAARKLHTENVKLKRERDFWKQRFEAHVLAAQKIGIVFGQDRKGVFAEYNPEMRRYLDALQEADALEESR